MGQPSLSHRPGLPHTRLEASSWTRDPAPAAITAPAPVSPSEPMPVSTTASRSPPKTPTAQRESVSTQRRLVAQLDVAEDILDRAGRNGAGTQDHGSLMGAVQDRGGQSAGQRPGIQIDTDR